MDRPITLRSSAAQDILERTAFQEIKPRCVAVSQLVLTAHLNPKIAPDLVKALEDLHQKLLEITKESNIISQGFADYIFFPLSHIFRQQQTLTDRVLELTLQCVEVLIDACWKINVSKDLAKQLVMLITFILGGTPGKIERKISEETKLAGIRCLRLLFQGLEKLSSIKTFLIELDFIPALGHCITTLLDILVQVQHVQVQIVCAEALESMLIHCISDDDVLASFFPGIVSATCKALDPRNGNQRKSKSLVATIRLLRRSIVTVLSDQKTSSLPELEKPNNSNLKITRTKSWLKGTASQVQVALAGVLRLRTHRLAAVRREVGELCGDILHNCQDSLASTRQTLIQTLVTLVVDCDETIRLKSEKDVQSLCKNSKVLTESLQASVHDSIISLPRILQSNDDDKKTRYLRQIFASFQIMNLVGVDSIVLTDMLSQHLRDGVLALLKQKDATNQVVHGIAHSTTDLIVQKDGLAKFPPMILSHSTQIQTHDDLTQLLRMLGSSATGLDLVQNCLQSVRNSGDDVSTISIWMAMNMLNGSSTQDDWLVSSTLTARRDRLVDDLCSTAIAVLVDNYDDADLSSMAICVAIEAISFVAKYMKEGFQGELVEALYPIVHLLGSDSPVIQNHAIICLNNIAHFCNYSSTQDLLLHNVDYLINAVSLKLNIFDLTPQAPTVLLMMIKLTGPFLIPYLDDLVLSLFTALDNFHGYEKLTELLFSVLKGIVEEAVKGGKEQFMLANGEVRTTSLSKTKQYEIEDLLLDVELFGREKQHLDPLPPDPSEEDQMDHATPHEPWGKPKDGPRSIDDDNKPSQPSDTDIAKLPPTYITLQSITKLCQNYLTHSSPSIRLYLLNLINSASSSLALQQEAYLPLINQLWPTIITCISDTDPNVAIAAAQTVSRICCDSGEFLSSRVNEAWPDIFTVYIREKAKKDDRMTYTAHWRLWKCLVDELFVAMVEKLRLDDDVLDGLLDVCAESQLLRRGLEERGLQDAVWLRMLDDEERRNLDVRRLDEVV